MRLSMEDVKRHKENKYEVMCRRGTVRMSDGNIIGNLCDTIEAQHDEIEQLQAQVAAMRGVILELKPSCGACNPENCESDCETLKMFEMIDEALTSDAGKGYHNPVDLEALKQARESVARVEKYANVYAVYDDWEMVKEALTAIDKAIGGGKVE